MSIRPSIPAKWPFSRGRRSVRISAEKWHYRTFSPPSLPHSHIDFPAALKKRAEERGSGTLRSFPPEQQERHLLCGLTCLSFCPHIASYITPYRLFSTTREGRSQVLIYNAGKEGRGMKRERERSCPMPMPMPPPTKGKPLQKQEGK